MNQEELDEYVIKLLGIMDNKLQNETRDGCKNKHKIKGLESALEYQTGLTQTYYDKVKLYEEKNKEKVTTVNKLVEFLENMGKSIPKEEELEYEKETSKWLENYKKEQTNTFC